MTAPLIAADTRIDPAYTRRFGCEELHGIYFEHRTDRGGPFVAVSFQIPETPPNLIEKGLAIARAERARVSFLCDTHGQARTMYDLARRLLPDHRHVAMQRAEAGALG